MAQNRPLRNYKDYSLKWKGLEHVNRLRQGDNGERRMNEQNGRITGMPRKGKGSRAIREGLV